MSPPGVPKKVHKGGPLRFFLRTVRNLFLCVKGGPLRFFLRKAQKIPKQALYPTPRKIPAYANVIFVDCFVSDFGQGEWREPYEPQYRLGKSRVLLVQLRSQRDDSFERCRAIQRISDDWRHRKLQRGRV